MDTMKQTSFQNMQGEADTVESMGGQFRAQQAQQALSLHKVDMEASVMEVSCGGVRNKCCTIQNKIQKYRFMLTEMWPNFS